MKKWIAIVFLTVLAGGAGWWFFARDQDEPPEYSTAPVTSGELTQAVTATGTLNPVVNVTVGSQISGYIQKLYADFNSPVTADQVVAQLDSATYEAIVHQCEGDVAQSQAALELARVNARRGKDLVAQNAGPQAELDSALGVLHQAEATVKVKEANLEKARVDLERCTIRSPISGTVISRSVDVGQTVAASLNAPVLFIIANDLTKMQIDAAVAEADVGTVAEGQTVEFTVDAFPYLPFAGKVMQVRNAATTVQNVVTYDVVISVENPELKLKPGMTANVSIVVAHRDETLKFPNAALRFRPAETAETKAATTPAAGGAPRPGGPRRGGGARGERKVYVLAPGGTKPEPVSVKLGISDGVSTEVIEGLKAGDLVTTGMTSTKSAPAAPSSNPLSGGGRRF